MRMKYVVVLCDGMADEPLEELGGMTPLEKAHTPNLDRMAQISEIGMVQTVPDMIQRNIIPDAPLWRR